jgi:hypothetical protein
MSNKSLFEKLFEEVMQDDAEALGLPSGEEGGEAGGEELGGQEEQGEEVTFTLDRATAQKLHDVLMAVLGGEEEGGEEGEGEEQGGEKFGGGEEQGGMGDEAAEEEEETEDEDSEEEEDEEPMKESPQSKYEPFETKGKAATLQKKSNARVQGAVANKTSAHGKAEKTSQTQGTAHYMPMNTKYDDAKGSIKVNNPKYAPNGQGDSIFG